MSTSIQLSHQQSRRRGSSPTGRAGRLDYAVLVLGLLLLAVGALMALHGPF